MILPTLKLKQISLKKGHQHFLTGPHTKHTGCNAFIMFVTRPPLDIYKCAPAYINVYLLVTSHVIYKFYYITYKNYF